MFRIYFRWPILGIYFRMRYTVCRGANFSLFLINRRRPAQRQTLNSQAESQLSGETQTTKGDPTRIQIYCRDTEKLTRFDGP